MLVIRKAALFVVITALIFSLVSCQPADTSTTTSAPEVFTQMLTSSVLALSRDVAPATPIPGITTPADLSPVIGNGTDYVQVGSDVYFCMDADSYSTDLVRLDLTNGAINTLCEATGALYVYGDALYFDGYITHGLANDTITALGKLDLTTGIITYPKLYWQFLYLDCNTGVMYGQTVMDVNTVQLNRIAPDGQEKILLTSPAFYTFFDTNNTVYVSSIDSETDFSLYHLNGDGSVEKIASTSMADEFGGDTIDGGPRITELQYADGWLYFVAGEAQGSGRFYIGALFRVKPDGSGLTQLDLTYGSDFTVDDGLIYYNDEKGQENKYGIYYSLDCSCNLDGSGKTALPTRVGPIVYQNQQYIYRYGFDENDLNTLIRTDTDHQNPQTLITVRQNAADFADDIQNNLSDAVVVGDHIFYTIVKIDYNMSQGDFVIYISRTYCMMNTDGTGDKVLETVVYTD